MSERIDVLEELSRAIDVASNAAADGAYAAFNEIDGWQSAYGAVAQLMLAAHAYYSGYCVDEAEDTFDMSRRGSETGCDREQHEAAKRLRDALRRVGAL